MPDDAGFGPDDGGDDRATPQRPSGGAVDDSPAGHVHEAVLTFDYDASDAARVVERSVSREVGEIGGDRTRTVVDRDGRTLSVTVTAADLVALRAGLNTWLTLVDVAERSAAVSPA